MATNYTGRIIIYNDTVSNPEIQHMHITEVVAMPKKQEVFIRVKNLFRTDGEEKRKDSFNKCYERYINFSENKRI